MAEEAAGPLPGAGPGPSGRVRPALAASLNNLAADLTDRGRPEEALAAIEEATGVYRELAAARPDAFRPALAASLSNLAVVAGLGRREEALAAIQEAVSIHVELTARWPDTYLQELEQSLAVVDWLKAGGDPSDASRGSHVSDNGPLSLPSVIVFHTAHPNASRLSPAHLGEAGMLSGRTRMPLTVWCTACGRSPRPRTGSRR